MRKPILTMTAPTADVLADPGATPDRLTPPERLRMDRLRRAGDRADFLAAHLLVRHCVCALLDSADLPVTIVQRCGTCGGPHGRPLVAGRPEVHVSLAHSRGVVAAAAGLEPVGIDVEAWPPPPGLTPAELAPVLAPAEAAAVAGADDPALALLRQWVRKEALLKAGAVDLEGLAAMDLSGLSVREPTPPFCLRAGVHGSWAVYDWADERFPALGAVAAGATAAVSPSVLPWATRG